jgi:hypothetical protein
VRALLVAVAVAAVAAPSTALPYSTAPAPGDAITQSELFAYLYDAPQSGDWVRYRVSENDETILTKTVGFGVERLGDSDAAFLEIQTQSTGIIDAPVQSHSVAGGSFVWKMFVDAPNFDDVTRLYSFQAGVIKIGDALFRLGSDPSHPVLPAYHQSLQSLLLYGSLPLPDKRDGTVVASAPEDLVVGKVTVHAVHTSVDFTASKIGVAAGLPPLRIEAWQTPDVPLGIAAVRATTNGNVYRIDLIAFDHGSYRSAIKARFDSIQDFPGG